MLISTSGFPVETSGQTSGLDLTSVGALVAANFVAATELARLLGNNSIFKTSYHEGDDFNIYAYALDRDFLLTVVFGQETKPGTIWFYTKQSANTLNTILRNMPPLEPLPMSGLDSLDLALDDLFGEDSNARTAFLSYEDAIQQGILPNLKPKNQNEDS
jgi:predicted regulator of Ras-like GTPase activity (Roadblock/LC7/MglB family)